MGCDQVEAQGFGDVPALLATLKKLIALFESGPLKQLVGVVAELAELILGTVQVQSEIHPAAVAGSIDAVIVDELARGERLKAIWQLIQNLKGRISPEEFAAIVQLFSAALAAPNNFGAWLALILAVGKALATQEPVTPPTS